MEFESLIIHWFKNIASGEYLILLYVLIIMYVLNKYVEILKINICNLLLKKIVLFIPTAIKNGNKNMSILFCY